MNEEYRPSTDFVSRVMKNVYEYEKSKISFIEWLVIHPSIRYLVLGIGALMGIFKTVPAF
ncbi:MAG: hypothetical protein JW944_09160 [Deltaproteobacteria bacterium]|nr:hypothetical protein [Deltaproteobacteria bacterium]